MTALMGMLTGVGGGITRDILAGDAPVVLRSDLYALAALAGGAVVSSGYTLGVPSFYSMLLGACVCFFLRLMAIYCGWRAPLPRGSNSLET
jgi:uncharacterized membrane protein YeiH